MEVGPRGREEEKNLEEESSGNHAMMKGLVAVEFCHGSSHRNFFFVVGGKQSGDTCSEMLNS